MKTGDKSPALFKIEVVLGARTTIDFVKRAMRASRFLPVAVPPLENRSCRGSRPVIPQAFIAISRGLSVPKGRFELPRDCSHQLLKLARLPISPLRHYGRGGFVAPALAADKSAPVLFLSYFKRKVNKTRGRPKKEISAIHSFKLIYML